jgi:putative ATP-binding cassette transporter
MLKNLLKFYAQKAGSAWIRIVLFCVISGLSSGLVLTTINTAIQARFENALSSDHIFQFALLLSVFLLSTHFAMKLGIILSSEMMHELRTNLANRIANTDFAVIENYDKGEIFAHFAVDINQLVRTALSLINALQASVVLIFCLLYIAWLSKIGTLFILLSLILGISAYFYQYKKAREKQQSARSHEGLYIDAINKFLIGFVDLKLNSKKMFTALDKKAALSNRARIEYAGSELDFHKSFIVSKFLIFVVLSFSILVPSNWVTSESSIHFQILTAMLFSIKPTEEIIDTTISLMRGSVALEKINTIGDELLPFQRENEDDNEFPRPKHSINLKNLVFEFSKNKDNVDFQLGPLNLRFKHGDTIFIVGGNGSGKTSLLKLITGLYQPSSGSITVDTKKITESNRQIYCENFSGLFSEFYLFDKFADYENLNLDDYGLWLQKFQLQGKICGDTGLIDPQKFSKGQIRRLALVFLLLEGRDVIAFDEFSADQDPQFCKYFYDELLCYLKLLGKTVFVISHDDRYFDRCDHLVKLDKGIVMEEKRN